jgi:hypothetical protein
LSAPFSQLVIAPYCIYFRNIGLLHFQSYQLQFTYLFFKRLFSKLRLGLYIYIYIYIYIVSKEMVMSDELERIWKRS